MRSIINKSRTQYNDPVFNDAFSMFSSDCGFVSRACVAYRPETKGKVELTAKLVNRLKVYSGDITNFADIQKIASELNNDINTEICQATGKPPLKLPEAVYPKTEIQQCIIHQIRNTTKFVSYKDIKALMADLKKVYAAIDEQTALSELENFD